MTDELQAGAEPLAGLVSVDELGRREHRDWLIVDCRFSLADPGAGEAAYRAGHIPGAFYAHLDRDLSGPRTRGSGRHPLPAPPQLVALFSRWGIRPSTRVVVYDDCGGMIAARLWWLLRWMGHHHSALLNGGIQAWQRAGLPLSTDIPDRASCAFQASPEKMPVTTTSSLEQRLADSRCVLLDVRARQRYRGEDEPIDAIAGHVPGALNYPTSENLTQDGHFKSRTALYERFALWTDHLARSDLTVMCGSGVTACHSIFAMELAGLPGARLYPGSWSEWIAEPGRPITRDAQ